MKVKLKNIVMDDSIQCRAELDWDVIEDYYERMQEGDKFPPVVLFGTSEKCWIGDGWHRIKAASDLTLESIEADLQAGGRKDALKYALSANFTHGHRRTNEDKRRCVEIALREFPDLSSRQIAEMCGVGHTFVDQVRPKEALASDANATRITKDGREYPAKRKKTQRHTETESNTETEEPEKVHPSVGTCGPPSNGLRFASIAIGQLAGITDNDTERKQALDMVLAWIKENYERKTYKRNIY